MRLALILAAPLSPTAADFCTAEVKITGVPDYQQEDFAGANDCAPVASADVLGYWDAHGYPDLIEGSNSYKDDPAGVTALVDALKDSMRWSPSGTQIEMASIGIAWTASQRGYLFSAGNNYTVRWNDVTAEVDASHPAVLTMQHPAYAAYHSVACIGYDEADGTETLIVHDNWFPENDVHLNFDECTAGILTTVGPPPPPIYVDDDAPGDPGPGDPAVSDPLEDGTARHPYDAIREAVDKGGDGATVIVSSGTYGGAGNRDISFAGKTIKLRSEAGPTNCTVDCGGNEEEPHRAFAFSNGEGRDSVVEGFTLEGGYAYLGGAVYCGGAAPTIRNCVIAGNRARYGGGIFCQSGSIALVNCTVAYNTALLAGGGVYSIGTSSVSITNSILRGSAGGQISGPDLEELTVSYSDVEGSYDGEGNIDADPLFADPAGGDYHLKSQYGRWGPGASGGPAWVYDSVNSPCIDAGDSASDYSCEPRPNGDRINIGAYGNSAEASRSGKWWTIPGDANGDCRVNVTDMIWVRNRFGQDPTSGDNWTGDVNNDGTVSIIDLIFVRNHFNTTCE